MASRTHEFAELKRELDAVDADIELVNKRLDEAQGKRYFLVSATSKSSMMPVSLICCDYRWSCHRGNPAGGTFLSQRTSKD